jgi:hypothetical protein
VVAATTQLTAETVRSDPDAQAEENQQPDPADLALEAEREAWREAERARLRVEERETVERERREEADARAAAAAEAEVARAFETARTDAEAQLSAIPFHLADGTPARLTDKQRKDILGAYDDATGKALEIATRQVYHGLGAASAPLLGKDAADALQQKAGNKPVETWLAEFGESYASKSKFLTAMSDEAAAALVKSTPALQAVVKAAELREFKRGQKTPVGEPERAEGGRGSNAAQPQTRAEVDEMFAGTHKSGRKITLQEVREYRAKLSA